MQQQQQPDFVPGVVIQLITADERSWGARCRTLLAMHKPADVADRPATTPTSSRTCHRSGPARSKKSIVHAMQMPPSSADKDHPIAGGMSA